MDLKLLAFGIVACGIALMVIFWLAMLFDAIFRKFEKGSEKVIWLLVTIFTFIFGAVAYYFFVYRNFKKINWFLRLLIYVLVFLIVLFFLLMVFSI
jgi:hypothetical protein